MTSTEIATLVKMLEGLPQTTQARVVEHLREHIADLQDDVAWDAQFQRTQEQLVAAARQARKEIAAGLVEPIDWTQRNQPLD